MTSRDPARKIRLGRLWDELQGVSAGPSGAQQAEIDNALTQLAAERVPPLPKPWSRTARAAVRSRAADIPGAIGTELSAALPASASADTWWRMVGVLQGLLLGCSLVGVAWFGALLVLGVGGVGSGVPKLFTDTLLLPAAAALAALGLVGGWLTARICSAKVSDAAVRETEQLLDDVSERLTGVAQALVVGPAELELAELGRFRTELRMAAR